MSYAKTFSKNNRVLITDRSPRFPGETEARSNWQEIKDLPWGFDQRVALIRKLARKGHIVCFKTATFYGRARLFVSK